MLSPCLGREDVQRALHEALEESRWVTVVGPPGSVKTLLVRHVVRHHREHGTSLFLHRVLRR